MGPNWARVASGDVGASHVQPSDTTFSRSVRHRFAYLRDADHPLNVEEAELLATHCYRESIAVAELNGFSTIAFPLLASAGSGSGGECEGGDDDEGRQAGTPSHLASIALSAIMDNVHTAPGLTEVHVVARDDRELRALLFSPLLAQPTDETAAHGMRRAACTATELVVDTPVLKTVAKATMATATLAPGTKS